MSQNTFLHDPKPTQPNPATLSGAICTRCICSDHKKVLSLKFKGKKFLNNMSVSKYFLYHQSCSGNYVKNINIKTQTSNELKIELSTKIYTNDNGDGIRLTNMNIRETSYCFIWQGELGYLGGKGEASIVSSAKLNNRHSAHRQTDQLKGDDCFSYLTKSNFTINVIMLKHNLLQILMLLCQF